MGIKIDFGRLFPGLVILLIGLGLLALWLVLAVISFFFFFIPGLHGIFYVTLDVGIASLILIVCGALLMLAGVSGWGWTVRPEAPAHRAFTERRVDRDVVTVSERFGELVGVFISFLVLLFFIENQVRGTGFFTSAFGPTEQFLFYGAWVVDAVVSLTRAAYGRRNATRPLIAMGAFVWMFAAFWLLTVFPFNFAHLPDLLPHSIQFVLFWVNDQVGALVILLVGIGSLVNMFYNSAVYIRVRSELARRYTSA